MTIMDRHIKDYKKRSLLLSWTTMSRFMVIIMTITNHHLWFG